MQTREVSMAAVDIETTGLDWNDHVLSIAIAAHMGSDVITKSWCVEARDLFHASTPVPQIRHEMLEIMDLVEVVTMHNTVFDLSRLFACSVLTPEDVRGRLFDTMLGARMSGPHDSVSLSALSAEYKIGDDVWRNKKSLRATLSSAPVETLLAYNEEDVRYTLQLAERLWKECRNLYDRDFLLREAELCRVLSEIRVRGKGLDLLRVEQLQRETKDKLQGIYRDMLFPAQIQGANDRDGLLKALGERAVAALNRTEKGNASLDEESLRGIMGILGAEERALVDAVLEARHLDKMLSTWIGGMTERADAVGRVHPNYTVAGAVSYRLTCSNPNLQSVPSVLNSRIWQPYISADYSQAELRLAAMYARENVLARQFESGEDIHTETARDMLGDTSKEGRTLAKRCNFASIYNAGKRELAASTGLTEAAAAQLQAKHRKLYPNLASTSRQAEQSWKNNGYLTLLSGKRLYATKDDLERRAYKAFNQLIQGGVAEIVKEAMLKLDEQGYAMINQVHDSIELDLGAPEHDIKRIMESVVPDFIQGRTEPRIDMKSDVEVVGELEFT